MLFLSKGGIIMKLLAWSLGLSLFVTSYGPSWADELPPHIKTQITEVFTGWNSESFGINTVDPVVDPAGCKPLPSVHGYATNENWPGYHTLYAAALLAFAERATVVVVVDEEQGHCVAGRPKLKGLNILRE
jgi:hypothetical protein